MTDPFIRFSRILSLRERVRRWFDRRTRDAALAELDDARLRDIGLSPEEVTRVRAKMFW